MTKHLTDEQRKHIDKAIDILNPPDDSRDEAFRCAARQIRRWKAAAIPWDRDTVKSEQINEADAMEAVEKILSKRSHWEAEVLLNEERFADGIGPDEDLALENAKNVLNREISVRRRVAEKLPSRRGRKENTDKDRIWRHTVEQFEGYRPDAPKADKLAYADRLYLAITGDDTDQDWETPIRKFNERRRQAAA